MNMINTLSFLGRQPQCMNVNLVALQALLSKLTETICIQIAFRLYNVVFEGQENGTVQQARRTIWRRVGGRW